MAAISDVYSADRSTFCLTAKTPADAGAAPIKRGFRVDASQRTPPTMTGASAVASAMAAAASAPYDEPAGAAAFDTAVDAGVTQRCWQPAKMNVTIDAIPCARDRLASGLTQTKVAASLSQKARIVDESTGSVTVKDIPTDNVMLSKLTMRVITPAGSVPYLVRLLNGWDSVIPHTCSGNHAAHDKVVKGVMLTTPGVAETEVLFSVDKSVVKNANVAPVYTREDLESEVHAVHDFHYIPASGRIARKLVEMDSLEPSLLDSVKPLEVPRATIGKAISSLMEHVNSVRAERMNLNTFDFELIRADGMAMDKTPSHIESHAGASKIEAVREFAEKAYPIYAQIGFTYAADV